MNFLKVHKGKKNSLRIYPDLRQHKKKPSSLYGCLTQLRGYHLLHLLYSTFLTTSSSSSEFLLLPGGSSSLHAYICCFLLFPCFLYLFLLLLLFFFFLFLRKFFQWFFIRWKISMFLLHTFFVLFAVWRADDVRLLSVVWISGPLTIHVWKPYLIELCKWHFVTCSSLLHYLKKAQCTWFFHE